MPQVLTTFNAPPDIRARFDEVCHLSGRTRTSVLLELMEYYILTTVPKLDKQRQALQDLDHSLRETRRLMGLSEHLSARQWKTRNTTGSRPESPDFWMDTGEEW